MTPAPRTSAYPSRPHFTVLGPLAAHREGAPALPRAARSKQRLVLGVLLSRPNTPVGTDALTDAVWPDDPPRTARKNLQVYVSSLRTLLGDGRTASRASSSTTAAATRCASRTTRWTPCG
ncbi:AfsR/SARP family transcriptional regulator [Streptomyces albidoflavus]